MVTSFSFVETKCESERVNEDFKLFRRVFGHSNKSTTILRIRRSTKFHVHGMAKVKFLAFAQISNIHIMAEERLHRNL
ncbi:unnamed protein product [Tenebrio molitor]|nr:unnamed protein product [Tenebrio molitor]